ncbi:MAG: DUF2321 domain-containing protein [Firmicutes bacterium]|nr:DUF2321 domain-containing protein [Bacillota bacterium]
MEEDYKDYYEIALVCQNGHVISDRVSGDTKGSVKYCPVCGAGSTDKCGSCGEFIRGFNKKVDPAEYRIKRAPHQCHRCGELYPWTKDAIQTFERIIDAIDVFKDEEKAVLRTSITDLIEFTPNTCQAIRAVKGLSIKIKETWGWGIIEEILKDISPEDIKARLGI